MTQTTSNTKTALFAAWASILAISSLPDIFFRELGGYTPAWLYGAKTGLLALLLLAALGLKQLRPLRLFFASALAIYILQWGVAKAFTAWNYTAWFAGMQPFQRDLFAVQLPRAITGGLLVLAMWALTGGFARFFFVKGDLNAPAGPIPWILTRPPAWRFLGPAIAGAMCLGLLAFTFIFGSLPSAGSFTNVLPLLPFVLLFAASNAFGEEILYRAPWLSALEGPTGPTQALLMTAAYFGLGHFYGVPYGVTGVIMAFVPGWLMGKAMLETRGFFWSWLIHLSMDSVIFFLMALGSITPGG